MEAKRLILLAGFILLINLNSFAQATNKFEEIKIKTSAQCEMCKERIEETLAFVKGIKSADLTLENKILTVIYKPGKITPDKIRNTVSKAGYDADEVMANPKAYMKLPACCKKPDDPESTGH